MARPAEYVYASFFASTFDSLENCNLRWPGVRTVSLPLRNDENKFLNLADWDKAHVVDPLISTCYDLLCISK